MNDTALQALADEAFVYAFPLHEMTRMRAATASRRVEGLGFAGDGPESTQRWCNTFIHARKLLKAGGSRVVTPNNDTLYTNAWIDLADGPLVIDVPDTAGRYYVLGLLDFYTNPFAHLGTRLTGNGARSFLIAGPDWRGEVSAPFDAPGAFVRAPTRWVWIIGRILVDGEHELPAVHALQDRFLMRPLDAWRAGSGPQPKRFDARGDGREPLNAASFVRSVNRALRENPPPAQEAALVQRFAAVGIGSGCPEVPGDAHAALLQAAIDSGTRRLQQAGFGAAREGWELPPQVAGSFGDEWLLRATVALRYIGMLESAEAYYPMVHHDRDGRELDGHRAYRLRFAPGQLPPVNAFWSLTMYDRRDFMLVPNVIDRYAIGDRTPGLERDADGGLTLYLQRGEPRTAAARANWLPTPDGPFYLCLRAYLPRPEMLDGRYALPGLEAADSV